MMPNFLSSKMKTTVDKKTFSGKGRLSLNSLCAAAFAAVIALNAFAGIRTIAERYPLLLKQQKLRQQKLPYFTGLLFDDISLMLQKMENVEVIGYLTNRDMSQEPNLARYAMAQYMVAPVILDLKHVDYPYLILDGKEPEENVAKIFQMKLVPLNTGRFGVFLTRKGP